MKKETIQLLENFSGINSGILIRAGNVIRTISVSRTVFASAVVDEAFPREFAIYDLNEFLKTLALFQDPEVEYTDTFIAIKGDGRSVKYHYSAPTVVVSPPDKNPADIQDPLLSFKLSETMFENIMKAAGVLRLKEVRFDGENKEILVFNKDNSGNEYRIELPAEAEGEGTALLSINNLKMLSDDYNVVVGEKTVQFKSASGDNLLYVVGREAEAE